MFTDSPNLAHRLKLMRILIWYHSCPQVRHNSWVVPPLYIQTNSYTASPTRFQAWSPASYMHIHARYLVCIRIMSRHTKTLLGPYPQGLSTCTKTIFFSSVFLGIVSRIFASIQIHWKWPKMLKFIFQAYSGHLKFTKNGEEETEPAHKAFTL